MQYIFTQCLGIFTARIVISTTKPDLIVTIFLLQTSQINHVTPYWIVKINEPIVVLKIRQKLMFLKLLKHFLHQLSSKLCSLCYAVVFPSIPKDVQ